MNGIPDELKDWRWRLANLYWIVDEFGKKTRFYPNESQLDLIHRLHAMNLVLKARQHGFTTLIDIMALDQAMWNDNFTSTIIAHGLREAEVIFRTKVKFPWDNLPGWVKDLNPLVNQTQSGFVFASGSSIHVGTSGRSGTIQFLHISEYGKICRRFPDKADEIKTGSLPAVHAGGLVFIESTAEGSGGHFFDMVKEAEKRVNEKPNNLEFKLHFYPWWQKESYRVNPDGVIIGHALQTYFKDLEAKMVWLDEEQRAWYAMKHRVFGEDMKQEYPSTPEEAFEGAMKERYFAEQMSLARREGRIKAIPILTNKPVNLFWDLGRDTTAVWFHQYAALEHRFIDYLQDSGKTMDFYVRVIQKRGYLIGTVYLPHDAVDKSVVTTITAAAEIKRLMPGIKVRIVPRVPQLDMGINTARTKIAESYFHEINCAEGIECLDNYRKKWNETIGNWSEEPVHDKFSHGADAYRQFAQGWEPSHEIGSEPSSAPRIQRYQSSDATMGPLG